MRLTIAVAFVAAFLAAGAAHSETPTLESIETAMDQAWKKVPSLSAEVSMEFVMAFGSQALNLTGQGELHVVRDGEKVKFRKTVTSRLAEPFSTEMKLDILFDGKKVYTTTTLMGQAQKRAGEPSLRQGALPPGGGALVSAMEKEMDLTVLPNSTIDNEAVFVVEGRAKDPQIPFSKVVFYLDQALGIQRKVEIYQPDGSIGISEEIKKIEVGSAPDPALFVPEK